MKSVRSRISTRSISRRPRGSKRHSSTRSACFEKSAKLTPPPSHVAPSGYARPRQTVLGATMDRAGASTGGVRLRRNAFRRLHQVAAVRAPTAVLLPLHRVVGHAHHVEEALRRAEGLLHRRRDELERLLRVVAPESFYLTVNHRTD